MKILAMNELRFDFTTLCGITAHKLIAYKTKIFQLTNFFAWKLFEDQNHTELTKLTVDDKFDLHANAFCF